MNYGGGVPDWHQYNVPQTNEIAPSQNVNAGHLGFLSNVNPPTLNTLGLTADSLNKHQNVGALGGRNYPSFGNGSSGSNIPNNNPLASMVQMQNCIGHYGSPSARNPILDNISAPVDPRSTTVAGVNEEVGYRNSQVPFGASIGHQGGMTCQPGSQTGPTSDPCVNNGNGGKAANGANSIFGVGYTHGVVPTTGSAVGHGGNMGPQNTNVGSALHPGKPGSHSYVPCKGLCCSSEANVNYQQWEKYEAYQNNAPHRENVHPSNYRIDGSRHYGNNCGFRKDGLEGKEIMRTNAPVAVDHRRNFADYKFPRNYNATSPRMFHSYPSTSCNYSAEHQKYFYPAKEHGKSSNANAMNSGLLKHQDQSFLAQQKLATRQYQYQSGNMLGNGGPAFGLNANVATSPSQHPYFNSQSQEASDNSAMTNRIQSAFAHNSTSQQHIYQHKMLAMQRLSMENHLRELSRLPGYQSHPKYKECVHRYREVLKLQQTATYQTSMQQHSARVVTPVSAPAPPINLQFDQNGMLINSSYMPDSLPKVNQRLVQPSEQTAEVNASKQSKDDQSGALGSQKKGQEFERTKQLTVRNESDDAPSSFGESPFQRQHRQQSQFSISKDFNQNQVKVQTGEAFDGLDVNATPELTLQQKVSKAFANKPDLDVRQFLANWDETDDEEEAAAAAANLSNALLSESTPVVVVSYENVDLPAKSPQSGGEATKRSEMRGNSGKEGEGEDNVAAAEDCLAISYSSGENVEVEKPCETTVGEGVVKPGSIIHCISNGPDEIPTIHIVDNLEITNILGASGDQVIQTLEKQSASVVEEEGSAESTGISEGIGESGAVSTGVANGDDSSVAQLDSIELKKQHSFEEPHNTDDISLPDLPTSECTPISTTLNTPTHSDTEECPESMEDLSISANPIEVMQNSPVISFTQVKQTEENVESKGLGSLSLDDRYKDDGAEGHPRGDDEAEIALKNFVFPDASEAESVEADGTKKGECTLLATCHLAEQEEDDVERLAKRKKKVRVEGKGGRSSSPDIAFRSASDKRSECHATPPHRHCSVAVIKDKDALGDKRSAGSGEKLLRKDLKGVDGDVRYTAEEIRLLKEYRKTREGAESGSMCSKGFFKNPDVGIQVANVNLKLKDGQHGEKGEERQEAIKIEINVSCTERGAAFESGSSDSAVPSSLSKSATFSTAIVDASTKGRGNAGDANGDKARRRRRSEEDEVGGSVASSKRARMLAESNFVAPSTKSLHSLKSLDFNVEKLDCKSKRPKIDAFEDCNAFESSSSGYVNPIFSPVDKLEDQQHTVPVYSTKDGKISYSPNRRFTYHRLMTETLRRESCFSGRRAPSVDPWSSHYDSRFRRFYKRRRYRGLYEKRQHDEYTDTKRLYDRRRKYSNEFCGKSSVKCKDWADDCNGKEGKMYSSSDTSAEEIVRERTGLAVENKYVTMSRENCATARNDGNVEADDDAAGNRQKLLGRDDPSRDEKRNERRDETLEDGGVERTEEGTNVAETLLESSDPKTSDSSSVEKSSTYEGKNALATDEDSANTEEQTFAGFSKDEIPSLDICRDDEKKAAKENNDTAEVDEQARTVVPKLVLNRYDGKSFSTVRPKIPRVIITKNRSRSSTPVTDRIVERSKSQREEEQKEESVAVAKAGNIDSYSLKYNSYESKIPKVKIKLEDISSTNLKLCLKRRAVNDGVQKNKFTRDDSTTTTTTTTMTESSESDDDEREENTRESVDEKMPMFKLKRQDDDIANSLAEGIEVARECEKGEDNVNTASDESTRNNARCTVEKVPKVIIKRTQIGTEFKCEISQEKRLTVSDMLKWQPKVKLQRLQLLDHMVEGLKGSRITLGDVSGVSTFPVKGNTEHENSIRGTTKLCRSNSTSSLAPIKHPRRRLSDSGCVKGVDDAKGEREQAMDVNCNRCEKSEDGLSAPCSSGEEKLAESGVRSRGFVGQDASIINVNDSSEESDTSIEILPASPGDSSVDDAKASDRETDRPPRPSDKQSLKYFYCTDLLTKEVLSGKEALKKYLSRSESQHCVVDCAPTVSTCGVGADVPEQITVSLKGSKRSDRVSGDARKEENMPLLVPEFALRFDSNSDRDSCSRSPPVITNRDEEVGVAIEVVGAEVEAEAEAEGKGTDEEGSEEEPKGKSGKKPCSKDCEMSIADLITQLAYHEKATIKHKRYCNLCERWFPTISRHRRHLAGYQHRYVELTQRKSIHTLFILFTGQPCPRLLPANVIRSDCSIGELTPLQIAVRDVAKHVEYAHRNEKSTKKQE